MPLELKIKVKTLAVESRIIRKEELKQLSYGRFLSRTQLYDKATLPYGMYLKLHQHRVKNVRREARATHLALGYIKGTPYRSLELSARVTPGQAGIEPRILSMVRKYSNTKAEMKDVTKWMETT